MRKTWIDITSLDLDSATFVTSDRSVSAVEATWREPLKDEDGRTGSVYAEHEDKAPRWVVVRFYK